MTQKRIRSERHKEQMRAWFQNPENRLILNARARERYAADPEFRAKRSAKHRIWREANREKWLGSVASWRAKNPEKVRQASHKRRARKRGAGEHFTLEQIEELRRKAKGKCGYCGRKGKLTVDHIKALSIGGTDTIENIQLTCYSCNSRKGRRDPIVFAQSIGLLL